MKSPATSLAAQLLLCCTAVCGAAAAAQSSTRSVAEQYLFQAANTERIQRGLAALRWDDALYRAATNHAMEMARRRRIAHQYPGEAELSARCRQAGAHFSVVAENVAEGPTALRVHEAWMNSPGHRQNLLDPRVDAVAISVISHEGQLYAVQDFERAVVDLSFTDQENAVAALVHAAGSTGLLQDSTDARRTCELGTGYAGTRQPAYVVRYTSADLSTLPESLRARLASGRYREAAIGACALPDGQAFTAYSIAVLLFP